MTLLSILGKLPASTSAAASLDKLDYQKIGRMAIVVFVGTFAMKVTGTTLTEANLTGVLLDAAQAGLTAVATAAAEAIRRLVVSHMQ